MNEWLSKGQLEANESTPFKSLTLPSLARQTHSKWIKQTHLWCYWSKSFSLMMDERCGDQGRQNLLGYSLGFEVFIQEETSGRPGCPTDSWTLRWWCQTYRFIQMESRMPISLSWSHLPVWPIIFGNIGIPKYERKGECTLEYWVTWGFCSRVLVRSTPSLFSLW